jgi:2-dehydro-3-deoxy-L-rhamnonate dehydrogenase (NAD+)
MNQLDLNGRNAVVTGGASGLGFAIAERLVASGANVVIWDLNGKAAQAAGKQLGAASIAADVRDPTSVRSAVQKTLGHVPRIDILINNAGISGPNAKLWEYPVEDWKRIFAVNVEGTFYCCRTVVPLHAGDEPLLDRSLPIAKTIGIATAPWLPRRRPARRQCR